MNKKISLPIGILATMNVMFGTGVLINTTNLINLAGFYGFLAYVMVGILLIPLLYAFAKLLKKYPQGGFFAFSNHTLGSTWAFLSAWAYFTGKLASATLLIHVFSLFFQRAVPFAVNTFYLDLFILSLFIWLNYYGMKTGVWLTCTFIMLKLIPVITIIASSFMLINQWHIPTQPIPFDALFSAIPLVLYAFVGFEAACSLSIALKDPEKNATLVLIIAFSATVALTIIYQLMVFLGLSSYPYTLQNYIDAFVVLFSQLPVSSEMQQLIASIIYLTSGFAALGGSYGILLSNTWNLYILAHHKHIPYAHLFTKKNRFDIPFACVLAQGVICIYYFLSTGAQQIILQQTSVLGCSISFLISSISFAKISYTNAQTQFFIALCAFLSACVLMSNCFISIFNHQPLYLGLYAMLLVVGILCMLLRK